MLAINGIRRKCAAVLVLLAVPGPAARGGRNVPHRELREQQQAQAALSPHPYLVVGFMGGIVHHDDPIRSEYKVAEDLRSAFPAGVHVETFENRRRGEALKKVLQLLDTNQDGVLSDDKKRHASVILYGHSWGGAAVVQLARQLEQEGIPVLLTVQVDSVGKHDGVIPSNVARAANFYQPNGLIHGRTEIRAADPSKTEIIGNFRMNYKHRRFDCREFPWYERLFAKTHTQIACDPGVWAQVELLIRAELPPPDPHGPQRP